MSSLNDSSLELLCALRQFTKVVIHLPSQYKIFVRLCKLVGSQCPSKAVCHCSKACETTAVKSAVASKGKMCLRNALTSLKPNRQLRL